MLCSPQDREISRSLKVDLALTRAVWTLYPPCAQEPALFVAYHRRHKSWAVVQKHKALNVGDALSGLIQQSEREHQQAAAVGEKWGIKPNLVLPPSPLAHQALKNINLGRVGSVPETVWKVLFYLDDDDEKPLVNPTAMQIAARIRLSDNRLNKIAWKNEGEERRAKIVAANNADIQAQLIDVLTPHGKARRREQMRPRGGLGPNHGSRFIGGLR